MPVTRVVVVAAVAAALVAATASAKTFEVTKRGDPTPGACKKRDCSLREAVIAANARGGSDKIVLPEKKAYKLSIPNSVPAAGEDEAAEGDLDLLQDIGIVHPGKGTARVDAQGIDRAFHLHADADTTIKKLGIRNGVAPPGGTNDGGAILIDSRPSGPTSASLTLTRSKLVNNDTIGPSGFGGAIADYGDGRLVITRSRLADNTSTDDSGAIDISKDGGVVIKKSTIEGNRSEGVGGVGYLSAEGGAQIVDSTIAGNFAGEDAGGFRVTGDATVLRLTGSTIAQNTTDGYGGGIEVDSGRLVVSNSTIAGNRAGAEGGGIANTGGAVVMNATTVVRNHADTLGGGLTYGIGTPGFQIENSLVAFNTAPLSPDCFADSFDPMESGGHNLVRDDSGCEGIDASGDIVGQNAKIGRLKDNGGPTRTVALKKGSPAINKADKESAPNKDQRGTKRDKKPDIGAYERVKSG